MTLTFNIIFTTGTVAELRAFAWSILRHADCRLRLVANGLADAEENALRRFAGADARLLFHRHPGADMAEHGDVLNALLAAESGDTFAFMDSDVFACGPFLPAVESALEHATAVFSGVPVWATAADQIAEAGVSARYGGPQNHLPNGACLGTSYFAVYRTAPLRQFIATQGVGLEKVKHADALSAAQRRQLAGLGGLGEGYETAKALNLLLVAAGHRLQVIELEGLCHVGGLSLLAKKRRGGRRYLPEDNETPRGFANPDKPWIARKRYTCQYLSEVVSSLARRTPGLPVLPPPPQWPAADVAVRERVLALAPRLGEVYRDFHASGFETER